MAKRYDVMAPRPGREEGKTFWHRVGAAWDGDKGIGIVFDSLPIPDREGRVSVWLFEPREKQDGQSTRQPPVGVNPPGGNAPQRPRPSTRDLDDEVPF